MNLETLRLIDLPPETLLNVYTNLNDQGVGRLTQTCRFLYDQVHLSHKEWIHKASIFHNTRAGFWTERKVHFLPPRENYCAPMAFYLCPEKQKCLIYGVVIVNNKQSYSTYEIKSPIMVELHPPVESPPVPVDNFRFLLQPNLSPLFPRSEVTLDGTIEKFKTQMQELGPLVGKVAAQKKIYSICEKKLSVCSKDEPDRSTALVMPIKVDLITSIAVLGDILFVLVNFRALMFDTKTDTFMGFFEEDVTDFQALNVDENKGVLYAATSNTVTTYDFSGFQIPENKTLRASKMAAVKTYNIYKIVLQSYLKYLNNPLLVGSFLISLSAIGIGGGLRVAIVTAISAIAITILLPGAILAFLDKSITMKELTRATFTRP